MVYSGKTGSIIRIRSWNKSLILIMSVRPHRNLHMLSALFFTLLSRKLAKL